MQKVNRPYNINAVGCSHKQHCSAPELAYNFQPCTSDVQPPNAHLLLHHQQHNIISSA